MSISYDFVKNLFDKLKQGHSEEFFLSVEDNVDWTVMGTHPLAGHYSNKQSFLKATFQRLNKILKEGVVLEVLSVIVSGNQAVVEMRSLSTAVNGKPFNNSYCWVVWFNEKDKINKVRAYVDSALVQNLINENEK